MVEKEEAKLQKHPLKYSWSLWYEDPLKKSSESWGGTDVLKKVYASISSVETFWRVYDNILQPSQLPLGVSYCLFKDGILPTWEDISNEKGGKWLFMTKLTTSGDMDKQWLALLMACIGQQLEEQEQELICGATISLRRGMARLCVWTKDADNKDANLKIGAALKRALDLPSNFAIYFKGHWDKSAQQGRYSI